MPIATIGSFFNAIWQILNPMAQIAILTLIFYYVYGIIHGTRSEQILMGGLLILFGLGFFANIFHLDVILFLLNKLLPILAVALVVIFQPELRQTFLSVGGRKRFALGNERHADTIETIGTIAAAADTMSKTKTGAIIAIERGTHLSEWTKEATRLDAPLVRELLLAIFYPGAPLHDGGVIVKDKTIVAARCVFPTSRTDLGRGTRHRAALGLSERTDAAIVVVSEETGSISVACEGHFFKDLDRDSLSKLLTRLITRNSLASRLAMGAKA